MLGFFLLVDPQFAISEARAANRPLTPAFYFTLAAITYLTWMTGNVLGGLFGNLIEDPARYGLDFILPIYFAGLVIGFRSRPKFLPILIVSVVVSQVVYFTIGQPWHITLGGAAGLMLAAMMSRESDPSVAGHGGGMDDA